MKRIFLAASAALVWAGASFAQEPLPPEKTPPLCVTGGSPNVVIEGKPALRLSDVANCDPSTYEVNESFFVNGEPSVRLIARPDSQTGTSGAASVIVEGAPASRVGDN